MATDTVGAGMDERLLAWGRAVKQRRASKLPVLWLFTDTLRLPDPLPAIAQLPQGLCGVVFRHDGAPGRVALALRVAELCARRRLPLVVAGDSRLAMRIGVGFHLRGGKWPDHAQPNRGLTRNNLVTASAHNITEMRRARRAGAKIVFLSPAFPTASHPGENALGAVKWVNLARRFRDLEIYCLGGVTGRNIHFLGRFSTGAGAITVLFP
jgi:thiamine-phosphate pyrophosphorylase